MSSRFALQAMVLLAATPMMARAQPLPLDADTTGPAWSPYLVGALIGVLSMFTFYFGDNLWLRLGVGFLGGGLMAFGARMAGGCISGALQLSVGSWIALAGFFVGGIITAMLMFYA